MLAFSYQAWSSTQDALQTNPTYVGMRPGASPGLVVLSWLREGPGSELLERSIVGLRDIGFRIEYDFVRADVRDLEAELDRLTDATVLGVHG